MLASKFIQELIGGSQERVFVLFLGPTAFGDLALTHLLPGAVGDDLRFDRAQTIGLDPILIFAVDRRERMVDRFGDIFDVVGEVGFDQQTISGRASHDGHEHDGVDPQVQVAKALPDGRRDLIFREFLSRHAAAMSPLVQERQQWRLASEADTLNHVVDVVSKQSARIG